MTGRLLVCLVAAGALAAMPAAAQAPVQLYPRAVPAAPAPGPEPARPVTPPEPLPPIAPPPASPPPASPPPASPPPASPPPAASAPAAPPRGIAVTPLPPVQSPPAQSPPFQSPPTPAPRDEVLAAVEGFYGALGRGDGQRANEFLVPEKRNQGAYEVAAMTRFYSAMSEPLRVLGLGRLDPEVVRVQYAYTHQSGRRCDGVADVTVRRADGRALIERIRALSGC